MPKQFNIQNISITMLIVMLLSGCSIHHIDNTERLEREDKMHENVVEASGRFFEGASSLFKSFNTKRGGK